MILNALNSSTILVYPLKIGLSWDTYNVLEKSSVEDRGDLFSETVGVKVSKGAKIRNRYNQVPHLTQDINGKATFSGFFHPLQIDKMVGFDDLI